MTDESSAAAFASGVQWLANHRRAYIESGGSQGHIVDLRFSGGRRFSPHLLLHYIGRKSGKSYINPLFYSPYEGDALVVASKHGADFHPSWFLNLTAREGVRFQIGTQAFSGTYRVPEGEERDRLWQFMTIANPAFAGYQASTKRIIPVVRLTAGDEIPVFTAADAD